MESRAIDTNSHLERQGWNWAPVPKGVILSDKLSHADVRVYAYILWRSGTKSYAWPSVETVAKDLHMSNPAVRLSFKSLVRNNWIRRCRRLYRASITYIFEHQSDCKSFVPPDSQIAVG